MLGVLTHYTAFKWGRINKCASDWLGGCRSTECPKSRSDPGILWFRLYMTIYMTIDTWHFPPRPLRLLCNPLYPTLQIFLNSGIKGLLHHNDAATLI